MILIFLGRLVGEYTTITYVVSFSMKAHWKESKAYLSPLPFRSDARLNRLESAFLDGSDRRLVLDEKAKHPFSLSVFEDTLYWSDWQSREVLSCNKFTGKNHTVVVKERLAVPYGITVSHYLLDARQSLNPCDTAPCTHMCLVKPNQNYQCFCPKVRGERLTEDPRREVLASED